MNTGIEYSTRVVQEGDRRCKKSTLNDLAYLTPLRIPLMNPVIVYKNSIHITKDDIWELYFVLSARSRRGVGGIG